MSTPVAGSDGRPELLVLRALKLGDLLVAVPALRALRRAHPEHRLVLATSGWLAPVADLVGGVDVLLPTPGLDNPLPPRPGRVDVAVNLHGRGPQSHALLDRLEPRQRLGFAAPGWPGPAWSEDVHERERWAGLVRAYGHPADAGDVAIARPATASPAPGAVVVHVGAFYGSRAWPVDRFAAVAAALVRTGRRVVLSGGDADRDRAVQVGRQAGLAPGDVLAGRTDLAQLAALVADAALLVTVDTGAAHLATAYGTRSVVLFGPAPVEQWGPPADGPHVVLTDARLRRGEVFSDEPDPALLAVTVDQVLAAAAGLLEQPAAPG